jgi:ribosomal protein L16/L10AE
MGKGKGTFEFWATRYVLVAWLSLHQSQIVFSVPTGRVIFEVGGVPIREEIAREGSLI